MTRVFYFILRWLLKLIASMPMSFLFLISSGFYYLLYYVFRYRRNVVEFNLAYAFPEKTKQERHKIAKGFYRHFCDIFFEIIALNSVFQNHIKKRIRVSNIEILDVIDTKNKPVVLLTSHFGNWEFPLAIVPDLNHTFFGVYKPFRNKKFNDFMLRNRSFYNTIPVALNEVFRKLIEYQKQKKNVFIYLIADQRPLLDQTDFWYSFMGHEVPVITGPEKIARKMDCPVIYMEVAPEKRGYYHINLTLLTDKPSDLPENRVTEMFFDKINESIKKYPTAYLWSHKRFKYTRDKITKETITKTKY